MTNVPDFRGRVESGKPQDFFHRVAEMIPGYTGYQDKERRREADKELRMYLARQFRDQHSALVRVQQQIARSRHLEAIGEVDRLAGVLQRFIDKLETATQGYAGLFDPIQVREAELDQLYTFDAALTEGLGEVTDAIETVGAAAQQGSGAAPATTAGDVPELPSALSHLSTTLDHLLQTWNHRNDVLMSGRSMPAAEFDKFRSGMQPQPAAAPPQGSTSGSQPYGGPTSAQPESGSMHGGQPHGGTHAPGAAVGGAQPYGGSHAPAGPTGEAQPYGGVPAASGRPYQPYAGAAGSDADETPTRRLDPLQPPSTGYPPSPAGAEHASDVDGHPTGGPGTDRGGSDQ
ncbi:MAG TPA: hypothetical protein VM536_20645 [Chloroflexia bacterium]|nr:hypothetical protein [Chloroflexia bacterium]